MFVIPAFAGMTNPPDYGTENLCLVIHFTEEHWFSLNIIACTASIVYNSYERME